MSSQVRLYRRSSDARHETRLNSKQGGRCSGSRAWGRRSKVSRDIISARSSEDLRRKRLGNSATWRHWIECRMAISFGGCTEVHGEFYREGWIGENRSDSGKEWVKVWGRKRRLGSHDSFREITVISTKVIDTVRRPTRGNIQKKKKEMSVLLDPVTIKVLSAAWPNISWF